MLGKYETIPRRIYCVNRLGVENPGAWGLLKAIKSLLQFANKVRMLRISESVKLSHENILLKITIKKCIFKIKLAN